MSKRVHVALDESLIKQIDEKIKNSQFFTDRSEFIRFVLVKALKERNLENAIG